MGLFQKTLLFSVVFHLLVLGLFAIFLPSKEISFRAVPVELVTLPLPPEKMGREEAGPLPVPEVEAEPENALVRVYVPGPDLPDFDHPVAAFDPGRLSPELSFPEIEEKDYPYEWETTSARAALVLPGPGIISGTPGVSPGEISFELAGPGREREPLYAPLPEYPEWAMEEGLEAFLELKLWIDGRGEVTEVSVHRSSGWPELDFTSLRQVEQWRFAPGDDVLTWAVLPLRFSLSH